MTIFYVLYSLGLLHGVGKFSAFQWGIYQIRAYIDSGSFQRSSKTYSAHLHLYSVDDSFTAQGGSDQRNLKLPKMVRKLIPLNQAKIG